VAGIAALLFSVRPDLSAEQVIAHIKDTADNIDGANPGFRGQLGTGRINALAALERAVGPAPMHIITATAGSGGAVVPEGAVSVPSGGAQRFEFVPDPGYAIADVLVDGHSIGTPTAYNLTSVSADHTLAVTFVEQPVREEPQDVVNINTATAAALAALPYIGAWLAAQIVSYRQTHGQYGSIWDLSAVGMSTWAIRQIATLITV
jgi:DNA uptake protein ComE-like DNA-binding protein